MPFLTPKYIVPESKLTTRVKKANLLLAGMGSDRRIPTPDEENEFFTGLIEKALKESRSRRAIERHIYRSMMKATKRGEINFFTALRYFWNRAMFVESNTGRFITNYTIEAQTPEYILRRDGERMILPVNLTRVPTSLVPNLVMLMAKYFNISNTDRDDAPSSPGRRRNQTFRRVPQEKVDLQRAVSGDVNALMKYSYEYDPDWVRPNMDDAEPEIVESRAGRSTESGESFSDGYFSRTRKRQIEPIASVDMIVGILHNLEPDQIRRVEEFLAEPKA